MENKKLAIKKINRKEKIRLRKERIKARDKRIKDRLEDDKRLKMDVVSSSIIKKTLTIEICIHCHRYQHRLCWMLSSILQQKGDKPNINVSISYCPEDGVPTTQAVCNFFREQGLNIYETVLTEEQVPNRSIGRNSQTKEIIKTNRADWILFADSDMVYDPYFFENIQEQLNGPFRDITKVIGADRISLDIPFCIEYFEKDNIQYPAIVDNVAKIPEAWPVKWVTGKRTCPGNFQLASVASIIAHGGVYTNKSRDVWRRTRSDRGFRTQMGGRCPMEVKPQYHLNHDRAGPDLQR